MCCRVGTGNVFEAIDVDADNDVSAPKLCPASPVSPDDEPTRPASLSSTDFSSKDGPSDGDTTTVAVGAVGETDAERPLPAVTLRAEQEIPDDEFGPKYDRLPTTASAE